jgi:ABC-type multidrug transport system fused ATPase/permease subunit
MKQFLLYFFSFFLIFLSTVSAQGLFKNWYEYLNIPEEYSKFPELLYFVFIPFLGTFAIIWGILAGVPIFKIHKVNVLLSFIFAFSLLYTGILLAAVGILFQAGGIFAIIAFFVLFFGLTSLFVYRKVGKEYLEARRVHEEITKESLEKTIKKTEERIKTLKQIEREKEKIKDKLVRINKAIIASRGHLEIIADPTVSPTTLEKRYKTTDREVAMDKVRRILKKQEEEKRKLLERLEELEELEGRL